MIIYRNRKGIDIKRKKEIDKKEIKSEGDKYKKTKIYSQIQKGKRQIYRKDLRLLDID